MHAVPVQVHPLRELTDPRGLSFQRAIASRAHDIGPPPRVALVHVSTGDESTRAAELWQLTLCAPRTCFVNTTKQV